MAEPLGASRAVGTSEAAALLQGDEAIGGPLEVVCPGVLGTLGVQGVLGVGPTSHHRPPGFGLPDGVRVASVVDLEASAHRDLSCRLPVSEGAAVPRARPPSRVVPGAPNAALVIDPSKPPILGTGAIRLSPLCTRQHRRSESQESDYNQPGNYCPS